MRCLLLLVCCLMATAGYGQEPFPQSPQVVDLITKITDATGGIDAWRKVNSVNARQTASYEFGTGEKLVATRWTYATAAGKFAFHETVNETGNYFALAFDGEKGLIQDPYGSTGQIETLSGDMLETAIQEPFGALHVDPTERGYSVYWRGVMELNEVKYNVLKYTHANGYFAEVYYDMETNLKVWAYTKDSEGKYNLHRFGFFQEVGGVKWPTTSISILANGTKVSVTTSILQTNEAMDERIFTQILDLR